MFEKQLLHKEIGKISLKKSRKSKTIRITVKPDKSVTVTLPFLVRWTDAIQFVEIKKDWILDSFKKLNERTPAPTIFSPSVMFRTKEHVLVFEKTESETVKAKITSGKIIIYYPSIEDIYSTSGQDLIHRAIIYALKKEAKKNLPERVAKLAQQFGFSYRSVFIKNLKSRWGSCSSVNNINLNIHLMRLPDYLIDYVILHELVHTIHKNHGKQFWEKLGQVTGNAKGLAKEMKNYRTQIY